MNKIEPEMNWKPDSHCLILKPIDKIIAYIFNLYLKKYHEKILYFIEFNGFNKLSGKL